ncbi:MAG: hypothetical protein PHI12_08570 [Dehalococcoidales bacterium]|nr:hypothetical protein [Dehalococcoidales bacterium]
MSQDFMRRAYKASDAMEPVALLDDFVRVITNGQEYFGKVDFFEAIPPFQCIDFCAVPPWGPLAVATPMPAATSPGKYNVTNLDLDDDEFGQWRWFPLDNIQVGLYLPSGVAKWSLKNIQGALDRAIVYRDPLLVSTEFYSWEDQRPAMQPTNFSGYVQNAARIVAFGYRYHISQIKVGNPLYTNLLNGNTPCTPVICKGFIGQPSRT